MMLSGGFAPGPVVPETAGVRNEGPMAQNKLFPALAMDERTRMDEERPVL
jgi:hypothetical protein